MRQMEGMEAPVVRDFVIVTENTCDLPRSYYEENGIVMMSLNFLLEGQTYTYEDALPETEFYEKLRNGSMPTTSQVNPEKAAEIFEKLAKEGKDVLDIVFSSGLSGSYNSCCIAAEEVKERYPDWNVRVVDSLCASMGEGLLVHKAVQLKKAGKTLDEIAEWLESNKLHLCHNFTVNDLFHLYRGGRVSRATAVLGSMVGVKPILHVDEEGHLINIDKVRGRKRSLIALVDRMEKQLANYEGENDIIFISHGDCEEDAKFVAEQVQKRFGYDRFLIHFIGPVIGTHSGPGTVALFFMGEYR